MSFEATQRAWGVRPLSAPQRLVLLRLAEHAGADGCSWPSMRLLIEYTELSERTIRDALRALEAAGHIKTEHRQNERGNPISNRYRLTIPTIINGATDAPPVTGAPGVGQELPGGGAAFAQGGATFAPSYIESVIEPSIESGRSAPKVNPGRNRETPGDTAIKAWRALERGSGGPEKLGLVRHYGQAQELPLSDSQAGYWAQNWYQLSRSKPAPTLADWEKLGRWISAGHGGKIPACQLLGKAGAHASIGAWLDQSTQWDGKTPAARPGPVEKVTAQVKPPAPPMESPRARHERECQEAIARGEAPPTLGPDPETLRLIKEMLL